MRYVGSALSCLAVLGMAAVLTPEADASHCNARIIRQHYVAPYVAPVVAYPVYPYVASYADPALTQALNRVLDQNKELILALRAAPQYAPGPQQQYQPPQNGQPQNGQPEVLPQKQDPKAIEGVSLLVQRCAKCHEAGGKNPTFFQNGQPAFDHKQAIEMTKAMREGRMPKGQKLTDNEFNLILGAVLDSPREVAAKEAPQR